MNVALKRAQFEYDNRLPEESADSAEQEWIEDGVEHLLACRDVTFKRALHAKQGVTFERFAHEVDEFVINRLGEVGASPSVIGRLILLAKHGSRPEAATAAIEAIGTADPDETLRQIARELLTPLAKDGVAALAEDSDL